MLSYLGHCPRGRVGAVGPCEFGPDDTTYPYIVIRERDCTQHHFQMAAAVPGVSQLVKAETMSLFVFWETKDECRLWCVLSEDGQQAVDFEALRAAVSSN